MVKEQYGRFLRVTFGPAMCTSAPQLTTSSADADSPPDQQHDTTELDSIKPTSSD